MAVLASGPIWRRGDLSRFEEGWQRKPGRPPNTVQDQLGANDELEAELGNLGRSNT